MNADERRHFQQLTRWGKVRFVALRYVLLVAIGLPIAFLIQPIVRPMHDAVFNWQCAHGLSRDVRCKNVIHHYNWTPERGLEKID